MSWEDPTPPVTAFRTMLVACAANVAAGIVQVRFHYPLLDLGALHVVDEVVMLKDPLPAFELEDVSESPAAGIAGGAVLGAGVVAATLLAPMTWTIGQTQAHARLVARQLLAQQTGLPLVAVDVGEATDITFAAEAGQAAGDVPEADPVQIAYRACVLTARYQLSY